MSARTVRLACLAAIAFAAPPRAGACPFCSAETRTLTEEMNDSSVVVLARLAEPSEASKKLAGADVPAGFIDPETGAATFSVERVVLGEETLAGTERIEAIYFGDPDTDRLYFLRGMGDPPDWAIPFPLSEVAAGYVPQLLGLPAEGADRLAFFQQYLEHEDPLLSQDSYDEFARAPYEDVLSLGPRMDRDRLRAWIDDPQTSPSRRRLFLTMLGVCGDASDLTRLEGLLTSDARVMVPAADGVTAAAMAAGGSPAWALLGDSVRSAEQQRKLSLDALVACYLTLSGRHGDPAAAIDLVDRRYLKDAEADYSHVYAVLQALRFLAEEQTDLVPLERVLASARLLLDNPDFADQVIPDLSRWGDWSVLDRLAAMYKGSFDGAADGAPAKFVREPVIAYLDVAAQEPGEVGQRATAALAELEALDPAAVARARSLQAFGFLAQARAKKPPTGDADAEDGPEQSPEGEDPSADEQPPSDDVESVASDPADTPPIPQPPAEAPAGGVPPPVADAPSSATPVAAPAPSAAPPGVLLLAGATIGATTLLVGLFWLILRGGVS